MTPYGISIKLSKYRSIECRLDSSIISLYLDTNFVNLIIDAETSKYTVVLAYMIYTYCASIEYRTQFWYRQVSTKLWYHPSSRKQCDMAMYTVVSSHIDKEGICLHCCKVLKCYNLKMLKVATRNGIYQVID